MGKKRDWRQGDLVSKNSVGGSRYLHYWFYDSGLTIQNFEAAKRACLLRQLKHFKTVRMKSLAISGSADLSEIYKLVNETTGQQIGDILESKMASVFAASAKPATSSASAGIGGESFASMGQKARTPRLASATIGDLTSALVASQEASQNALDGIIETLRMQYGKIVDEAIKASTLEENLSTQDIKLLIQDAIRSGSKFLKLEEGDKSAELKQSIARINVLIQLIPLISQSPIRGLKATYSHGNSLNINSRSQLLAVMLGKISGNLNALGGLAEEIAVARGLELALKEGANVCVNAVENVGQNSKYVDIHTDSALKDLAKNPLAEFIQGKDDVKVVVTKNGVTISYGLSVKKATKNKKNNSLNVKLQDSISLNTLLNRLSAQEGVSKKYIYNVAAGRERKGESGLQAAWRDIVDYAVITSFLDALSGIGTAGNNSIALVINRKIYPVDKILEAVANNPSAIRSSGGRKREKFWHLNTWFGEKEGQDLEPTKALFRSNAVWGELQQAFQSTKLTISLNLAALKLT